MYVVTAVSGAVGLLSTWHFVGEAKYMLHFVSEAKYMLHFVYVNKVKLCMFHAASCFTGNVDDACLQVLVCTQEKGGGGITQNIYQSNASDSHQMSPQSPEIFFTVTIECMLLW